MLKKIAYYALGIVLAVIPFAYGCIFLIWLSYTDVSNSFFASACLIFIFAYAFYFDKMFVD